MKNAIVLSLLAALSGCVSATVSEPSVCDTQSASWTVPTLPALPAGTNCAALPPIDGNAIPAVSTSVQVDFSSALHNVSNIADSLNVNITQLLLNTLGDAGHNADLNWVNSINVGIAVTGDAVHPLVELATYTAPDAGGVGDQLTFDVVLAGSQIFDYLSAGQVTLTFTLQAAPSITACDAYTLSQLSAIDGNIDICVSATGNFSKKL